MSLLFFFNLFIYGWRIIALQYCVDFYQTLTWISHRYTHVPSSLKTCPGYCLLQWTLGHICLFELWFSPDMYPGVGLLDHVVALFLISSGTVILFSTVAGTIYITKLCRRIPFSTHLLQHCLQTRWTWVWVDSMVLLTGGRYCLIVVLICISLIINNIEYIFMCLGHLYVSFG